jgi:hypothetical protein
MSDIGLQKPGCGGFGKVGGSFGHTSHRWWLTQYIITVSLCVCVWVVLQGNFKDLFKSIEQYENDLGINM